MQWTTHLALSSSEPGRTITSSSETASFCLDLRFSFAFCKSDSKYSGVTFGSSESNSESLSESSEPLSDVDDDDDDDDELLLKLAARGDDAVSTFLRALRLEEDIATALPLPFAAALDMVVVDAEFQLRVLTYSARIGTTPVTDQKYEEIVDYHRKEIYTLLLCCEDYDKLFNISLPADKED